MKESVIGMGYMGLVSGACMTEKQRADTELTRRGIGSDPRICCPLLHPKAGCKGSCYPKDVSAQIKTSTDSAYVEPKALNTLEAANDAQRHMPGTTVKSHFGCDLSVEDFAPIRPTVTPNKLRALVAFDGCNLYAPKFVPPQDMATFQMGADKAFGSVNV
jgi:UDP-glucose 6-dehydrogenase